MGVELSNNNAASMPIMSAFQSYWSLLARPSTFILADVKDGMWGEVERFKTKNL